MELSWCTCVILLTAVDTTRASYHRPKLFLSVPSLQYLCTLTGQVCYVGSIEESWNAAWQQCYLPKHCQGKAASRAAVTLLVTGLK
jgi:hypothetical protein